MQRAAHVVLVVAIVVGGSSGCSDGSGASDKVEDKATDSAATSPEPGFSPESVIAGRETSGGLCAEGPCTSELVIAADGSWSMSDESGASFEGLLEDDQLADLTEAVASTDLEPAAEPGTVCEAAADGRDVVYTFAADDGDPVTTDCASPSQADPLVRWLDGFAEQVG